MDTKEAGERIMGELMGAEYLERRKTQRNAFNDVLQDYSAEVCFGRVWARQGIDRKLRSVINIVALVALNRPHQLRNHLEGALNSGWTAEEIQEVLLHTAVYCGLPAAGDGFRVAEDVLRSRDLVADLASNEGERA
jgi:4-carboxymuconolactone decarboxylase